MNQDDLLEAIDQEGLTPELEDEVANQANNLIDRIDELEEEVLEVVIENL